MPATFRVASTNQLNGRLPFEFKDEQAVVNGESLLSTLPRNPLNQLIQKERNFDSDHKSVSPSSVKSLSHRRRISNLRLSSASESSGSQKINRKLQKSEFSHNVDQSIQPGYKSESIPDSTKKAENIILHSNWQYAQTSSELPNTIHYFYEHATEEYSFLDIPDSDYTPSISSSSEEDWIAQPVVPSPAISAAHSEGSDSTENTEDTEERIQGTVTPHQLSDYLEVQLSQHMVTHQGVLQPFDHENLDVLIDPVLVQMIPASSVDSSEASATKSDGLANSLVDIINRHIKTITPEAVAKWERTADDFDGHIDVRISPLFQDLCITDNNIGGHVVKMHSKDFKLPYAGARIGGCMFFNLPEAGNSETVNQIIRTNISANGRLEFILTFWGKLFTGCFGETNLGWAASINVTDAIIQVALRCESTETKTGSWTSESSDDEFWDDHWDAYLARLLLFIYTLQTYHTSLLVLGPSTVHQTQFSELMPDFGEPMINMPRHYQLKYMSAAVHHSGEGIATNIAKMTKKGRARMGGWLCRPEKHRMHIVWGEEADKKILYCVPVTDGRYDHIPQDVWWLCFMVSDKAVNMW